MIINPRPAHLFGLSEAIYSDGCMARGELCAAVKHRPLHLPKKEFKKKKTTPNFKNIKSLTKQEDYGWEMRSSCEEEG